MSGRGVSADPVAAMKWHIIAKAGGLADTTLDEYTSKQSPEARTAAEAVLLTAAREGTLHIFREDSPEKFSVVETVKTEFGARNAALDTKTHRLFIDTADFGPAPEPTAEQPHPQPAPVSGTFRLLVYGH